MIFFFQCNRSITKGSAQCKSKTGNDISDFYQKQPINCKTFSLCWAFYFSSHGKGIHIYEGLGKPFCYSLALSDCNSDEELCHAVQKGSWYELQWNFFAVLWKIRRKPAEAIKLRKKKKIHLGKIMQKLVIGHVSTTRGYNCSLIVNVGKIYKAGCWSCIKNSQLCSSRCLLQEKEEWAELS